MIEFIISNYLIFIIIAVVLLLGLFGYIIDRQKYEKYREELLNEERAINSLESHADVSVVAAPIQLEDNANNK